MSKVVQIEENKFRNAKSSLFCLQTGIFPSKNERNEIQRFLTSSTSIRTLKIYKHKKLMNEMNKQSIRVILYLFEEIKQCA